MTVIMRIYVAAGFDELTTLMLGWLAKLVSGESKRLFGEDASRAEFLSNIENMPSDNLLVVFYGHGTSSALLTAAHLGSVPVDQDKSHLCVAKDLEELGRVEVFAYCCSSSLDLGNSIREKNYGRFVGYRGELLFSTAPFEANAFERPLIDVVTKLGESGGVYDEAVEDLLQGYEMEHERWLAGEYSREDRSMMICMFLEEHMRLLDRDIGRSG